MTKHDELFVRTRKNKSVSAFFTNVKKEFSVSTSSLNLKRLSTPMDLLSVNLGEI